MNNNIEKLKQIRTFLFYFKDNKEIISFINFYAKIKQISLLTPQLILSLIRDYKKHEILIKSESFPTINFLKYSELINLIDIYNEKLKEFNKNLFINAGDTLVILLPIIEQFFNDLKNHIPEGTDELIFKIVCQILKKYLSVNTGINPTSAVFNAIMSLTYATCKKLFDLHKEEKKKKKSSSKSSEKEKILNEKEKILNEKEKILNEREKKITSSEKHYMDKKEKLIEKEKEHAIFMDQMRKQEITHEAWRNDQWKIYEDRILKKNKEEKKKDEFLYSDIIVN